jgi:hypothetical protein
VCCILLKVPWDDRENNFNLDCARFVLWPESIRKAGEIRIHGKFNTSNISCTDTLHNIKNVTECDTQLIIQQCLIIVKIQNICPEY